MSNRKLMWRSTDHFMETTALILVHKQIPFLFGLSGRSATDLDLAMLNLWEISPAALKNVMLTRFDLWDISPQPHFYLPTVACFLFFLITFNFNIYIEINCHCIFVYSIVCRQRTTYCDGFFFFCGFWKLKVCFEVLKSFSLLLSQSSTVRRKVLPSSLQN